jgi:hypothetical protein
MYIKNAAGGRQQRAIKGKSNRCSQSQCLEEEGEKGKEKGGVAKRNERKLGCE